jgi:hypothetical protein
MGACNCISREAGKNEPDLDTEKYRILGKIKFLTILLSETKIRNNKYLLKIIIKAQSIFRSMIIRKKVKANKITCGKKNNFSNFSDWKVEGKPSNIIVIILII